MAKTLAGTLAAIVSLTFLTGVYAQTSCVTHAGAAGACVDVAACKRLNDAARSRYRTAADEAALRDSLCDAAQSRQPRVCCAHDCATPEGDNGTCVALEWCAYLRRLATWPGGVPANVREHLRRSGCAGTARGGPSVCCGTRPPSVVVPRQRETARELLPAERECGTQPGGGSRVLFGSETELGEFAWIALIKYRGSDGWLRIACAASLFSRRYALTAAHCLAGSRLAEIGVPYSVVLGEHDIGTDEPKDCVDSSPGNQECADEPKEVRIENFILHPQYVDVNAPRNDIAIIRLERGVNFTDYIRPVCLPTAEDDENANGRYLTVAGWGLTEHNTSSLVKLKASLRPMSLADCNKARGADAQPLWVGQMCAGGAADRKDACGGDSGGPLMRPNEAAHSLVGIVSFGPVACGTPGVPGVYTRVFPYLEWIKAQMEP